MNLFTENNLVEQTAIEIIKTLWSKENVKTPDFDIASRVASYHNSALSPSDVATQSRSNISAQSSHLSALSQAYQTSSPSLVPSAPAESASLSPASASLPPPLPSSFHINAYADENDLRLGREHRGEVVLKKILLPLLQQLNPQLPEEALTKATAELTKNRAHLSLVNANHEIYKLLRDGFSVACTDSNGARATKRVRFFDFTNPQNNHFLCVSQLWITGEMHMRRPDVIIFVNGIPLLLFELKAAHKNLIDAYRDNIRDYKDTIPQLFWYNMGIILANGIESKFGTLTAHFEFFSEWKKVDNESDVPQTDFATLVRGICDKERLLDIFENYILFDESQSAKKKIVPRYFQYFGVNQAFAQVIRRKENQGKLGVFWHTQGSGKSYSMVYLTQKVLRKLSGNFTFVIITDRKDLDRQIYKNFVTVGAVYEKDTQATSINHLRELLLQDHRQIFTTIQKFQNIAGAISMRDDIIVMTDEAHRTQYDYLALNMRKTLPNAAFIGFTGTPLLAHGEEKTRATFGDYVSIYNFAQSVADGATVPLFYENRIPRLKNVNANLEQDLGKIMEYYDLHDEEEEKIEREFSTFYQLITRDDRLNTIARDIVQHFVGRGYNDKAMVVAIDKKTAVRMYVKVKDEWERYFAKLHMDFARTQSERARVKIEEQLEQHSNVDMAVIISQSQNEIAELEPFDIDMRPLRKRIIEGIGDKTLEEVFKDPDSNLRIVFVCAMWITGFDVPNLSTLYLDKPLKNHTLMQTIARANRIAEGKKNGLIVDYIGVFKNLERALALYATNEIYPSTIINSKDELLQELQDTLQKTQEFLRNEGIDIAMLLQVPNEQKLVLIEKYANILIDSLEKRKRFLDLAANLQSAYQAMLPSPDAEDYYATVTAIRVIVARIREVIGQNIDVSYVKKDLETLLDKSIQSVDYVITPQRRIKDLSKLDADALRNFFNNLDNKNLQVASMSTELDKKITAMVERNRNRTHFMDRLNSLLQQYNSGSHDSDHLFYDLMDLTKDLEKEEQRAVRENLTDDELVIFDVLLKKNLNSQEVEKVKSTSRQLLLELKSKLVIDWREKESARSGVKTVISKFLYDVLPYPTYTKEDCDIKGLEIYNFVYERYERLAENNFTF